MRHMPKHMRLTRAPWMDNEAAKAYWDSVRASIEARAEYEDHDEHYDCPTCGGLGWVRYELNPNEPGFGEPHPCPNPNCPAQRASRQRKYASLLEQSKIPKEYRKLSFADWEKLMRRRRDPHNEHLMDGKRDALGAVRAFVRAYPRSYLFTKEDAADEVGLPAPTDQDGNPYPDNRDAKCGIVLAGLGGMGKTSLAVCAAQALLELEQVVVYLQMSEFFMALKERFKPKEHYEYGGDAGDEAAVLETFQNVPVLILDELAQHPTEWEIEKAGLLFNWRMGHQLPTIVTTNILSPEDLSVQWGAFVASRIQTLCHWMTLGGIPLRRKTSEQVSR